MSSQMAFLLSYEVRVYSGDLKSSDHLVCIIILWVDRLPNPLNLANLFTLAHGK